MTSGGDLTRVELSPELASAFRHDLKGGLISLRMGLESLDDEEELKPLLLQTQGEVERLADQLLGLLRVESLTLTSLGCEALLGELVSRLETHYSGLQVELASSVAPERVSVDSEALWLAVREAAENALQQQATRLTVSVDIAERSALIRLSDNGRGLLDEAGGNSQKKGLGLHLVGRCLCAHGGSARLVPNRLGGGASLELSLPTLSEPG